MSTANTHSAEIIHFPRPRESTQDAAEIQQRLFEMRQLSVEDAMSYLVPPIYEGMTSAGFELKSDRKCVLLASVMRSIMREHYGLPHPLDEFIREHAVQLDSLLAAEPEIMDDDCFEYESVD